MDDQLAWLRLINTPRLGAHGILRLLEIYGSVANIFAAHDADLVRDGVPAMAIAGLRQADERLLQLQMAWLQSPECSLVTYSSPDYPPQLKQIADPPVALFVRGDVSLLSQQQIAIVGSRNPTTSGRRTAHLFASELAASGLVITSGLALGIDYCAHEGALTSGQTVAVLGTGPDIIYPARHRRIAGDIVNNGMLVSEFPPGTPALANHFPRRNRIISGLSLGVMVVEAATRSGSLITARCALDQGREVFAVPGPIQSPLSQGCHQLIKQGAKLVENIIDVIEEIPLQNLPELLCSRHENTAAGDMNTGITDTECHRIMQVLSHTPQSLDELIEASGLTAETVSSMLLMLEVQGHVTSSGGQYTKIN